MSDDLGTNTPQLHIKNTPLREVNLQQLHLRRYTRADRIDSIAKYYYKKTKTGITHIHLLKEGMANHKRRAQNTLKRFLMKGILFTIDNRRPQQYYPMSIKSEIMQAGLSGNIPIHPTGVNHSKHSHSKQTDDYISTKHSLDMYYPFCQLHLCMFIIYISN